jgi:hypothetical protein
MRAARRTRNLSAALAALASAGAVLAFIAPGSAGAVTSTTVQMPQRLCSAATPGHASCYAIRLVTKRVSSTEATNLRAEGIARPAAIRNLAFGPAGGYTPAQLAKAYGVNPNTATSRTVAIVDAFNDPSVRGDLNAFDKHYRLRQETTTSFKVVNQAGHAKPLPASDLGWAGEITLDVQAVRGLCHKCRILLVEASTTDNANLGKAVNYAAHHAKIISNSYGGPENDPENTAAIKADYNHPGVAVLASTGDDGYYDWDFLNCTPTSCDPSTPGPAGRPSLPASYNTVVGVGGTTLNLKPDSTRASETVWNDDGPLDAYGFTIGAPLGAAGSGCSTKVNAQRWQLKVAGYGSLGCAASRRNGVDVAADADYFTGFDTYETTRSWCTTTDGNGNTCPKSNPAWQTIGGTSLSSPLIAAMWALAGGPGGVRYPALSLYGHYKTSHPTYDVTVGGTGACDTSSPRSCALSFGGNPNEFGAGRIDCAWHASGSTVLANRYQCYAKPGYDGVSGVGTPKGLTLFKAMSPHPVIKSPGTVTHGVTKTFSASGTSDPFPGGFISKYVWHWGNGTSTTTSRVTVKHKYTSKGTRTITLTVTDNYGRSGTATRKITIS